MVLVEQEAFSRSFSRIVQVSFKSIRMVSHSFPQLSNSSLHLHISSEHLASLSRNSMRSLSNSTMILSFSSRSSSSSTHAILRSSSQLSNDSFHPHISLVSLVSFSRNSMRSISNSSTILSLSLRHLSLSVHATSRSSSTFFHSSCNLVISRESLVSFSWNSMRSLSNSSTILCFSRRNCSRSEHASSRSLLQFSRSNLILVSVAAIVVTSVLLLSHSLTTLTSSHSAFSARCRSSSKSFTSASSPCMCVL